MLIHRLLEDSAARTPDAIALIEPGRSATYAELDKLANRFGNLCRCAGVDRGDRVVIAVENSIEFVAAYMGAMKAGGVAVPLPAGPRSDRLQRAVADCSPRVCILDAATARGYQRVGAEEVFTALGPRAVGTAAVFHSLVEGLAACPDESPRVRTIDLDLAAIIYTSGSTGAPRGVMLTHRNLVVNARSIVRYLELTAADRVMCVLPFYYVYGLSLLHTHVAVGGAVVIDNRFAFPNVVLGAMQEHRATGFAGVPSTFALLMHRSNLSETPLPELRYVTQAGGGMPPPRILEWLERGPKVPMYVMYGATEAAARLTYLPPARLRAKLGSVGRPIPNVEILVVDDEGRPVGTGTVGELVARGSNISCGYWNDPAETREKFCAAGYRTGDLGYKDEDGYLFLVGRRSEMIKVGAHRVGAREIEDVIHEHPAVHEVAVVPAPHQLLGEVPIACVSLRTELDEAARTLQVFCASRLPAHKIPSRFLIRTELPKLPGVGKIDKGALRALANGEATAE